MNNSKKVCFGNDQMEQMAQFIAELVRQGVTWESENNGVEGWAVVLTGGY